MKGKLPRQELYTPEELAECWGVDVNLILRYTHDGKLHQDVLYHDDETNVDYWESRERDKTSAHDYDDSRSTLVAIYYHLEEIECFEQENGMSEDCQKTTTDSICTETAL